MAARDRRSDEPEGGGGAWLTTFADLRALILTFFVLLLASANMEKQKYAAVAESFREGFAGAGLKYFGRFAFGGAPEAFVPIKAEDVGPVPIDRPATARPATSSQQSTRIVLLDELNDRLSLVVDEGHAQILSDDDRVTVRFYDEFAFPSGAAGIKGEFGEALLRLMPMIASAEGAVLITGHTDSIPVSGSTFQSNWGLSTARAVAVVEFILANANLPIDQARLIPQGRGESSPIADNRTVEGRAKNRRVEISFLADDAVSRRIVTPVR